MICKLQQTAANHSSDIDFNNFKRLQKFYWRDIFIDITIVIDTTLLSDNPMCF